MRTSRTVFATLFCCFILLVFSGTVNSQTLWTTNGVPICTAPGSQEYPRLVADGLGGFVIVWEDGRDSGVSGIDIYAQRVDEFGNRIWSLNGMPVCTTTTDQDEPQLIADGSGGAIITWEDHRDYGVSSDDIYTQWINEFGDQVWTLNGEPVCDTTDEQQTPQIAPDGSGGGIITWVDGRNFGTSMWDIYALRINVDGNPVWPTNGVPVCTAADHQNYQQMVSDGSEGAIITWMDARNGLPDIYAQRLNDDGDPVWPADGMSICTAANWQTFPQIIADGSGGPSSPGRTPD